MTLVTQILIGFKFCAIFCPINTFFMGTCWYIETFFVDLKGIFQKIDEIVLAKRRNGKRLMNKDILIKIYLIEIIRFHNDVLR